MTAREAIRILDHVWGRPDVIGRYHLAKIAKVALPDEQPLETVCRVAGIPYELVKEPGCFDRVRALCFHRELQLNRGLP